MTTCLGIDPDTFNTGLAVVRDREVLYATSVAVDPKRRVEWRVVRMIRSLSAELAVVYQVDRIAVETMQDYHGKVRPQDLLHLNLIAGAALGAAAASCPEALLWAPKPRDWKGTMDKAAHQKLILKAVGLTAALEGVNGTAGLTAKQKGHIVDAIGLALAVNKRAFLPSER